MIEFDSRLSVMIGLEAIDFRCGMNKLGAIAQQVFGQDPKSYGLFVFRNKRKTDIKLVFYHKNGFFLGSPLSASTLIGKIIKAVLEPSFLFHS